MAIPPVLLGGLGALGAMALAKKLKKKNKSQDVRSMEVGDVTGQTQQMRKGGAVKKMAKGGMTRGDGACIRGKTKGRMV